MVPVVMLLISFFLFAAGGAKQRIDLVAGGLAMWVMTVMLIYAGVVHPIAGVRGPGLP